MNFFTRIFDTIRGKNEWFSSQDALPPYNKIVEVKTSEDWQIQARREKGLNQSKDQWIIFDGVTNSQIIEENVD